MKQAWKNVTRALFIVLLACVMGITFTACDRTGRLSLRAYADGETTDPDEQFEEYYGNMFDETAVMTGDEDSSYFEGTTDSFANADITYSCTFTVEDLTFEFHYESEELDVEETMTVVGYTNSWGRLDADIVLNNETFRLDAYKDTAALVALYEGDRAEDVEEPNDEIWDPELGVITGLNNTTELEEVAEMGLQASLTPIEQEEVAQPMAFGWLKALIAPVIIIIYVIVAETAEQIRAESNYEFNINLETRILGSLNYVQGVVPGNPVYDQDETGWNIGCAYYRFGFVENLVVVNGEEEDLPFSKVGCGVAAVYNLLLARGEYASLAEVIYNCEKWGIEFAFAWGSLGANACEIYRYLRNEGISYRKVSLWGNYLGLANNAPIGTHLIMTTWNEQPLINGAHTYYIHKTGATEYTEYNYDNDGIPDIEDSIADFNPRGSFMVGYLIYPED